MEAPAKYNAECLRRVANWTKIKPEHKFEKRTFDAEKVLTDMGVNSPKMVALLKNIKELDDRDIKEHGRRFKHFIFSDVKQGGYGSKIISSALIAAGMSLAYKSNERKKLELIDDAVLRAGNHNNFALLCSTGVFDEPINVKLKKEILSKFNERPTNIYGKLIRFIVMDSGFKEGIDLFDVKYVHIFEPQTSKADQKQVIGRGTRTCGQKGLEFHPSKGWPLHVFVYDVAIPIEKTDTFGNHETLFNMYVANKGIDLRKMTLADDLEKYSIIGSVDYELNKNIHKFEIEDDDNYFNDIFSGGAKEKKKVQEILCDKNCGKVRPTKDVPISIGMFATVYLAMKRTFPNDFKTTKHRVFFCDLLKTDARFCSQVRELYTDPVTFIKKHAEELIIAFEKKRHYNLPSHIRASVFRLVFGVIPKPEKIKAFTEKEIEKLKKQGVVNSSPIPSPSPSPNPTPSPDKENSSKPKTPSPEQEVERTPSPEDALIAPKPPIAPLTFLSVRNHIREHFFQFAWPKVTLENMCGPAPEYVNDNVTSTTQPVIGGSSIVNLTPTQSFIKSYFTPQNPAKGMLLYHSVGTGKTCAAIATASSTFEKEGYTILWVTRTTLKSDIWKNMFDQVCSATIKEKIKSGVKIPEDMESRMRLLSKSWSIRPMSYKQFSNLVSGSNSLYESLVKKNGTEDPLRKTLIIIDEAHKLYGGTDLSSVERPDMKKLHAAIMKSYTKSGDDSVRLMLMTATPFTNDPVEMIQLLNLCKLPEQQMSVDFDEFSRNFLTPYGKFSRKGSRRFLDAVAGHISYLNRERDARQFSQPRVVPVIVQLTAPEGNIDVTEVKEHYKTQIDTLKKELSEVKKEHKEKKKEARKELNQQKKEIKERCKGLRGNNRKECLEQVEADLEALVQEFDERTKASGNPDELKSQIDDLRTEQKEILKKVKDDASQMSVIHEKCMQTEKKKAKKSSSNSNSTSSQMSQQSM
jgi:superfamily II DNA or RNA helicase